MKKFFSVILCILCVSFSFVACKKEEVLSVVTVNGVSLGEYAIVYDDEDMFAQACAESLADLLEDAAGYELTVVSDIAQETAYEILIGDTNRSQSQIAEGADLDALQFVLSEKDGKIVLQADGYMVGGAANALVNGMILPAKKGNRADVRMEENDVPQTYSFLPAKNAILMIGDGMGNRHIEAAKKLGAVPAFCAESMPGKTAVTTYSYSVFENEVGFTDSAAAATALASGFKTKNGFLGMDHNGNEVPSVRELAAKKGAKTAILTTDVITGATPAGFAVHGLERTQTEEIQAQIDKLVKQGKLTVANGSLADSLASETRTALSRISADGSRFFAMVEEGWIDKHSHENDKEAMLSSVARFNDTVAYVMEFTLMHPDTVLLVTADHETGGLTPNMWNTDYFFTSEDHTNANVSLFAMGYGTEQLVSAKQIDNIQIAKFIAALYGESNFGGSSLL